MASYKGGVMSLDSFRLQDARSLVDCTMGRTPADLVIQDGQWVCVQTGEIIPHTDIAMVDGRIAFVGSNADHTIGEGTQVLQAKGRYLVPGLLDAHMHVESGMLTVTEFVRAVVPHGTTGMFIDPHEIANVFGLRGVRLMVTKLKSSQFMCSYKCPPAFHLLPGLKPPVRRIGPEEVAEAMSWPGIIGLGEMMNFPGVINADESMHEEMAIARRNAKVIGGHYASPDLGLPFHAYVAGGAEDDHEGTRTEDAMMRARQGMKVMMRYGSAWLDVAEQVKAVTEQGLSTRGFILCTDDSHSETLITEGHMNRVVRHAIESGLPPMQAIQMATINTADHFGLSRELGMIAPGRFGDVLLVSDLEDFRAEVVIARGKVAAEDGHLLIDLPEVQYPDWALQSVHIPHPLTAADFRLPAPDRDEVTANVIGVIENQAPTRRLSFKMPVNDAEVHVDVERDIAKIALVERHQNTGHVQMGLVHGFGFQEPCAVATSVAHDSHHLIVAGTNEADMALAVNTLAEQGGGQIVVRRGEVIGNVQLPIAGLISNERAEIVSQKASSVLEGFTACGCELNNPNMQLSLLALVVIPELRISNLGLVDVNQFAFIPVIE
jgi:adenine deaminase